MKNLVVLTGAGMSAESGLKTFRDASGLWEGHDVMEVASPEVDLIFPVAILEIEKPYEEYLDLTHTSLAGVLLLNYPQN